MAKRGSDGWKIVPLKIEAGARQPRWERRRVKKPGIREECRKVGKIQHPRAGGEAVVNTECAMQNTDTEDRVDAMDLTLMGRQAEPQLRWEGADVADAADAE